MKYDFEKYSIDEIKEMCAEEHKKQLASATDHSALAVAERQDKLASDLDAINDAYAQFKACQCQ